MILVTGASGCLGANLLHSLVSAGESVAALLLPGDAAPALGALTGSVVRRTGDVRNLATLRAAMKDIQYVYHAAGVASPRPADESRMWDVNVGGTRNLLIAANEAGVERVVHVSSIAAVGYPDGLYDETGVYNGAEIRFAYMHTKHAAELEVRQFVERGMNVVMACPAAVIAPYCDKRDGWGRIMRDVAARRIVFYPPGGIAYLGGKDLVTGLRATMQSGRAGERYLLASGNTTYRAMIDCFAAAAEVPPPRWTVSPFMLRTAARALRLVEPLTRRLAPQARISSGVLDILWRRKRYNVDKAARELGFSPAQTLEAAVADTWPWLAVDEGAQYVE